MSDLKNRHNIVDMFLNNLSSLKISNTSTKDVLVFYIQDTLEIKRYVKENKYSFSMYIKGTFKEEEFIDPYGDPYRNFNTHTSGRVEVNKSINSLVEVMRYDDGHFSMVSTANNDKWIEFVRSMMAVPGGGALPKENLVTTLNRSFDKLPLTEEYHFQRMTTNDGLVLDFDYCLKVKEIIDFIDSLGSIVEVNSENNLTVSLLFMDKLSGDA